MDENGGCGWIFVVAIIVGGYFLFFDDSSSDYNPGLESSYSSSSSYSDYSGDYEDEEYYYTDNPYDDGSGHYAGYEWAEENDVDSCGGNSDSFIEGCEQYLEDMGY